ncbi:MAG: neutral/alkaline non-lysosomal ceramidase N-terminal domain-containing protein [Clostridia bacterium]|nr:neutral/alkaline non-lysosomal ceramidase N-terminal domain-containing protein [Clostridia bacterium]
MLAGFGIAEMTPPLGVELAGYGYYLKRCARQVDDPTFARALYLQQEDQRYLLICCDILGLSARIAADVRTGMKEKYGIPPENVTLVSIHTHSAAAAVYHEGCGAVDPAYVQTIVPAIIRACDAAVADAKPVSVLGYSMHELDGNFIYNRACDAGPVDRNVRRFAIERENGKNITLFSCACHGVCNGKTTGISADFAGNACRVMAEQADTLPMFVNGLCGDIDPVRVPDAERLQNRQRFAETIVRAALAEKHALPLTVSGGCLHEVLKLTTVTLDTIHQIADAQVNRNQSIPGGEIVARIWEKEMTERFDTLSDKEPIQVHYLKIGGVPIVALPFEGFTAIGNLIRAQVGNDRAVTLGCADQLLGYLPTKDDIQRGAYAAWESVFLYKRLPISPGEAERLGTEIGKALR